MSKSLLVLAHALSGGDRGLGHELRERAASRDVLERHLAIVDGHVDCVVLPPYAGSCTLTYMGAPHACIDAFGSLYTPANIIAVCVGADRAYSAGHCPRNGDLYGVCASSGGAAGAEQDLYYYEGAAYPTDALPRAECDSVMGAWDPE
jgi:hypothetical protein